MGIIVGYCLNTPEIRIEIRFLTTLRYVRNDMWRLCAMASESGNDDLNRDNAKICETVSRISSKPDPLILKTENQRNDSIRLPRATSDCSPCERSRRTTVSEAISSSPMMTAWVAPIDVA